jgi:hypothetical protein
MIMLVVLIIRAGLVTRYPNAPIQEVIMFFPMVFAVFFVRGRSALNKSKSILHTHDHKNRKRVSLMKFTSMPYFCSFIAVHDGSSPETGAAIRKKQNRILISPD